ncbi:MAG: helix-turn-helix domain-containing protein [Ruminococcus sp.]|nr:helix-turn-helix domain-containing protein [Ruminococcus sp.]
MFYEQLRKACKSNHTSITAVLKKIGLGTANGTYWKNGSAPSSDTVVQLAELLNVSTDYLLLGKEDLNGNNISNSTIGAVGNNSSGTVTINNNSIPDDLKAEDTEFYTQEQNISDITKEIIKVSESLPMRERVKLLSVIYDFEENYRKSNT